MTLLLAAVEQEMEEQNGLELRLYVHEKNKAAIKAYRKSNFRDTNYNIMVLNRDT
jgi:ribosomal protein S18 acetylase RimI-like enzyme